MPKATHNDVLDGALNVVKNNANLMVVCSTQPLNYTEAFSTYKIADIAMVSGDFTLGAGDVSGRKATVAAKASVLVDTSGTPTHVCLLDTVGSRLLETTTCTGSPLTADGTMVVNFPAWSIGFNAPV